LPPSADSLRTRLISRNQDSSAVVAKRMAEAPSEISHWAEYDYVVVNADIETAHAQVVAILTAERLRRKRQIGLSEFVRDLTTKL
jgi:guanylate kinase